MHTLVGFIMNLYNKTEGEVSHSQINIQEMLLRRTECDRLNYCII